MWHRISGSQVLHSYTQTKRGTSVWGRRFFAPKGKEQPKAATQPSKFGDEFSCNQLLEGKNAAGLAALPFLVWRLTLDFPLTSKSPHHSFINQQISHLVTILCSTCRPKDKDKVLHSRLAALEPPSTVQSSGSATYESRLRMKHFNASERTSSSSYTTTRMAEKSLLQDKLCGFLMGKSLTRCRRKSPQVQQCTLKKFVFF